MPDMLIAESTCFVCIEVKNHQYCIKCKFSVPGSGAALVRCNLKGTCSVCYSNEEAGSTDGGEC
jgi:hypothetical protein